MFSKLLRSVVGKSGSCVANRLFATGKDVRFGSDARTLMLRGVDLLSDAVQTTLGPKGRNVIIEQSYGNPKITKDGVTVAKSIDFKDKHANLGASLIKSVANATNDIAGDGTTTATILARSIFKEGCKSVAAGINPMDLRRGIQVGVEIILKELKLNSKPISTQEEISQVATISANGAKDIGDLIALAMDKVGREGVITVQDGKTMNDELDVVEGMKFDRGYISSYFQTDTKTAKCELDNPLILLYDKKISSLKSILKLLEEILRDNRSLLIIAEDVEGEALATLVVNKLRGGCKVCAVKAPGFGDNRNASLQDLAVLTGASLISEDTGLNLEKVTIDMLGQCKKVTVSKDDTIIMGGIGDKDNINDRCDILRESINNTNSDYEKDKLKERLAKLSGGVAVIKVGGASEVEVNEKKDRMTDALNATRAAVEEGIVPGGGVALLYASDKLKTLDISNESFDFKHGVELVGEACQSLTYSIASNAGVEGAVVVSKLLEQYNNRDINDKHANWFGYNAQTDVYEDLVHAGIIDPLKVVRSALSNAASVASLMTTSEVMIVEQESNDKDMMSQGMPQGMPGGYGGGDFDMGF